MHTLILVLAVPLVGADAVFTRHASVARAELLDGPRVEISAAGVDLRGDDAHPFRASLRTASFGRESAPERVASGELSIAPRRVEIARAGFTEWFELGDRGLEQGWTVHQRPLGGGELWVGLLLDGDLRPRIAEDGLSAVLVDREGAPAARYHGLLAFDASGRDLPARLTSSAAGIGIRVDDREAVYPVTIDPWISGPHWYLEAAPATAFGSLHTMRAAGDVNGDGFGDVVIAGAVSAPVRVFYGSASGLSLGASTTLDVLPEGAAASTLYCVSTIGDVNNDGYDDVAVGNPDAFDYFGFGASRGRVQVFRGSAAGISTTANWTYFHPGNPDPSLPRLGSAVSYAGDLNGDGFDDFVVGVPGDLTADPSNAGAVLVVYGPSYVTEWVSTVNDRSLGLAASNAGDLNGDGFDDCVFGAPERACGAGASCGAAFLYSRTASGGSLSEILTGVGLNERVGVSVSGGGDFDGDGRPELLIVRKSQPFNATRIDVWNPATGSISGSIAGGVNLASTPSVAMAGDVNGDGYADAVIGEVGGSPVAIHLGGASGLSVSPAYSFQPQFVGDLLGHGVAAAGDVNGDGYADVLAGAPGSGGVNSRVYVIHGRASAPSVPVWTRVSNQAFANLGASVTYVGDLNGDGYDELAYGASGWSNDQSNEGRVFVHAGGANGPNSTPMAVLEGNQANCGFGEAIAGLGDVDGDGYGDLAVGAPRFSFTAIEEGMVFVYRGTSSGVQATAAWSLRGEQAYAHFGAAVCGPIDIDGDGYFDIAAGAPDFDNGWVDAGQLRIYRGDFGGPSTTATDTTSGPFQPGARFGASLAAAGDVDRDGFSDLVVGAPDYSNGQAGEGLVQLYRGSVDGPQAPLSFQGNVIGMHYGHALAGIGDVNGDGFADVAVGTPQFTGSLAQDGAVWILHGTSGGLAFSTSLFGNQAGANFGWSVAGAGDVNGDGFADLIACARNFDSGGWNDNGQVRVHYGSSSGISAAAAWTFEGNQNSAAVGMSVAGSGDLNGDGFADLAFGSPYHDGIVGWDEGQVFVSLGNHPGSTTSSGTKLRLRQRRAVGGLSVPSGGSTYSPSSFQLAFDVRGPEGSLAPAAGRVRARMQFQHARLGDGYAATSSTTWLDSAGVLTWTSNVTTTESFTSYRWRARLQCRDPFFRSAPWVTLSGRSTTEGRLRSARDCDGDGIGDIAEIEGGAVDIDEDDILDVCENPGTPYCFGDGSGGICPCGNYSAPGAQSGCLNSLGLAGRLTASGVARVTADSLVLTGTGMPNAPALYFQGTTSSSTAFGDGVRCASGTIKRLGTKTNVANTSSYPGIGDLPIHVKGEIPPGGGTRRYQAWYRNAAAFCAVETFNLTNGVTVVWTF